MATLPAQDAENAAALTMRCLLLPQAGHKAAWRWRLIGNVEPGSNVSDHVHACFWIGKLSEPKRKKKQTRKTDQLNLFDSRKSTHLGSADTASDKGSELLIPPLPALRAPALRAPALRALERQRTSLRMGTANLRTKILDFRGLDSSRILILRGGILMSIGNFPEIVSQPVLAGMILVGRLGVLHRALGERLLQALSRGGAPEVASRERRPVARLEIS